MKTKQFGDFVIASQTRLALPPKIFQGGPWTHLATVNRSLSEYVAVLHEQLKRSTLNKLLLLVDLLKLKMTLYGLI